MSVTKIKKELREARKLWAESRHSRDVSSLPGFVPGVERGLREALAIIEQHHREQLQRQKASRKPLSRWSAEALYRACQLAYGRLKQSDLAGAMRALQRAMERIQTGN